MNKAIALGMTAAALAAAGCTEARSQHGGPVVDRNYQVAEFDRIELAGAYDATVRTGAAPGVHARGNQKSIENLEVVVENGVLVIRHKKRVTLGWNRSGKVDLTVTLPNLRGIELAGAGDIEVDRVAGDSFEGEIAGTGDLRIGRVEVGTLNLNIAGAGSAHLNEGRARKARYEVAGAGDIDAKGVEVENAIVLVTGVGGVNARATKTAQVDVAGAGDVEMTGGAKCSVTRAGIGDVRCS